jgi:hypothetical protein
MRCAAHILRMLTFDRQPVTDQPGCVQSQFDALAVGETHMRTAVIRTQPSPS